MSSNIALGFRDFTVSLNSSSKPLLSGLNGFVHAGSITAVLGASASGKSLLLQSLSGRIQDLNISGTCFINGREVNPKRLDNPIAYVPQGDSTIGELTPREVAMNTAVLKRNEPRGQLEKDVDALLDSLGLSNVADQIIGTLIFRGLSGGQKKRVEIISELVASPSILLLDEPTSGLDSSIAFEVLAKIRDLVKSNNHGKQLSVILSIHQPNSMLLELFDHILLLDKGGGIFFGSVTESISYFEGLGFLCPIAVTPTDYFLKISDSNFDFSQEFDFHTAYSRSGQAAEVIRQLDDVCMRSSSRNNLVEKESRDVCSSGGDTSKDVCTTDPSVPFWRQVYVLIYREFALAYRDPTLYYFQVFLFLIFTFTTGAIFFQMPRKVEENFNITTGGVLWMTMTFSWVSIFKVYHLSNLDKRIVHELSNNKYSIPAVLLADSVSVAVLVAVYLPTALINYTMMGYPLQALPFSLLCCYVASLGSEAMLAVITKFSHNATTSMILCQLILLIIMVFGAGIFLPWKDCPKYWVWLQESTLVTQSSRSIIMAILYHMTFKCVLVDGLCISPGSHNLYPCDTYDRDGVHCYVQGRDILSVTQGIAADDSYWYYFGYLVAITVGYKLLNGALTYYPCDRIYFLLAQLRVWVLSGTPIKSRVCTTVEGGRKQSSNDDDKVVQYEPVVNSSTADLAGTELATSTWLTWTDFNVVLPKTGAKLIDDVSGSVKSGRVLALMGPSGAGKTTLLNGLSGRAKYAHVTGNVRFAGRKMSSADLTYVPQFDEINNVFTVMEHFLFVGCLTCIDEVDMVQRANHLVGELGLKEKKHTPVRLLSAGEIKRVSVGVGIISKPNVLFLDEPTTGLDSTAAFSIVNYIVKIAKVTNLAIIMTIHQPSALVFNMLDDLFLLGNGRTVYKGSISDAVSYFCSIGFDNPKGINPADYYLDLAQISSDKFNWQERFEKSVYHTTFQSDLHIAIHASFPKLPPSPPSQLKRFGYMLRYFMTYFAKEKGLYFYRMIALAVISLFCGSMFFQLTATTSNVSKYSGAMFFTAISVALIAVSSTAVFSRDRREAVDRVANGFYSPGIFVTTQFIASAVYSFAASLVFACIFHWMTNLNPTWECFLFDLLIMWDILILMEATLLTAIEVMKNDFLCTTFGLVFIGCNMIFSGFFRQPSASPVWISWMCYVAPFRWAFDGFVYQIFYSQAFTVSGSSQTVSGDVILDSFFHLRDTSSWGLWAAVLGYVLLFRVCQYFLFAWQTGKLPFSNL